MVIFAVFLFTTNVYAGTIKFTVGTGGTITATISDNINPSGDYVATGLDPNPFVMTPESNYQILNIIVSEGKKKTYSVLNECNDNNDGCPALPKMEWLPTNSQTHKMTSLLT